jgi:hypothetical protein
MDIVKIKQLLPILSPQPPRKEKQEKTLEHRVSFPQAQ